MIIKVYFDDNYLEAFKNMIYSAVVNKKNDTIISLEIGLWGEEGHNLSSDSRATIQNLCQKLGVEVKFIILTSFVDRLQPTSDDQRIPRDSLLARLGMILTAESDFLYLDVDLLLQPGWDDLLYLTPPNPNIAILGIRDNWLNHHGMTSDEKFGEFYINSGVFVFFVKPWVDCDLSQVLRSTISKIENSELEVRQTLFDQDVLNIATRNHKYLLDNSYNCQVNPYVHGPKNEYFRLGVEFQPKILHYIGGTKPFNDLGSIKFDILNMADSNANLGFIDSTLHYYYLYYYMQDLRRIWERNS